MSDRFPDGFPDGFPDPPPTHHETFARASKSDAPFVGRGDHGSLERVLGDRGRPLAILLFHPRSSRPCATSPFERPLEW